MPFFNKKKILVTHNSTFHTDDLFATATLSILCKGKIKVIRTRDVEMFKKGDFVYDVGGEYDPLRNLFDHHQEGGAGKRANGIPYAAFGLVWKKYGAQIAGSQEIADKIDEDLVQSIDADDNGIDLYSVKNEANIKPIVIQSIFASFRPSWTEEQDYDSRFFEVLPFVEAFLKRTIIRARDSIKAKAIVEKAYSDAPDKRLIVLDGLYSWQKTLQQYREPLYVIFPKSGTWSLFCVRTDENTFENRKNLPKEWAGKRDQEMAKISGVSDAVFCHNGLFLAVAKSKEGVLALAKIALEN